MSNIETQWSYNESSDTLILDRVQDVEPTLELNEHFRSVKQKSDWGRAVAEIPPIFIEKWLNEEWARGNVSLRPFTPEFDELVDRKLNDPDWKWLRIDDACLSGWLGYGS